MKKLKRIISAIVLTSITITLFQTNSIYADSMDGTPDGQADVDQNYKNPTGESGWNSLWQGYRFYIVDRNFNLVSSILDVTTDDPMLQMSGNEQYMYDSIAWEKNSVGVHERKIYKWTEVQNMVTSMPNSPNAPLFDSNNDNKYDAQGDNLRAWIEKGIGGLDIDKQILELKKMTSNTRKSTVTIGSLLPKTGGKSGQTTNSKSAMYSSQTTVDGIIQSAGGINSFFSDVYAQEAARQLVKDTGVSSAAIQNAKLQLSLGSLSLQTQLIYQNNKSLIRAQVYNKLKNEKGTKKAMAIMLATISSGTNLVASTNEFDGTYVANNSTYSNNEETYENNDLTQMIPTDGNDSEYICAMLNYYDASGNGLIRIDGVSPQNNTRTMKNRGYYLVVEPIFWMTIKWAGFDDSHPIYGTIKDIENYITNILGHGDISQTRDRKVTNSKGPLTLILVKNITLGSHTFLSASEEISNAPRHDNGEGKDDINCGWLSQKSDSVGYGMHIYSCGVGNFTKTRDDFPNPDPDPSLPHRAPEPDPEKKDDECKYNIVKVYQTSADNGHTYTQDAIEYSKNEPATICIQKEKGWNLDDWYVSKASSNIEKEEPDTKWETMYNEVHGTATQEGSQATVPDDNWKDNKKYPDNPGQVINLTGEENSTTLYMLFRRKSGTNTAVNDITESQISAVKVSSISSNDAIQVNKDSKAETDTNNVVLHNKSDIKTEYYNYDNKKSRLNLYHTIYRGNDPLTLYKMDGNNILKSDLEQSVSNWTSNVENLDDTFSIGGTPGRGRMTSSYKTTANLIIQNNGTDPASYGEEIGVGVYTGEESGSVNQTVKKFKNTNAVMVKSGVNVKFYPYIWMTTQDISNKGKTATDCLRTQTVNVLGEHMRTIQPNDYASINILSKGKLAVESNMWATDKSISQLRNKQNNSIGSNIALKGGATYYVTTPEKAKLRVTTYQTVSDDNKNFSYENLTDNEEGISVSASKQEHDKLVEDVENAITGKYTISQYVSKNADKNVKTSKVEVSRGASISRLNNGSSRASKDDKYYLSKDGNIVNSSLLETASGKDNIKYYRFFSLPNGDIYMVENSKYSECLKEAIEITEYVKGNNGTDNRYTGKRILKRGEETKKLKDMAKTINSKTLIVSKMLKALELNTGKDKNAPWAETDGKWYNEGTLGLTIMQMTTDIHVGIGVSNSDVKRVTILDPKLIPQVTGKQDQNTKIFSSNYQVKYSGSKNLGSFRKKQLKLKSSDLKGLIENSNTFYIPNSTVTDNE